MTVTFVALYAFAAIYTLSLINRLPKPDEFILSVAWFSLAFIILAAIASIFLTIRFWRGVFFPILALNITVIFSVIILWGKKIKIEHTHTQTFFYGLGTGGKILLLALGLMCSSISFAFSTEAGLASLTQFTMSEENIPLIAINSYIFFVSLAISSITLAKLHIKPDRDRWPIKGNER